MKSYTRLFFNQAKDKIKQLFVSPSGRYMAYTLAGDDCYVVANPLISNEMIVSGPTEGYYQYLLYLKSIMAKTDIPDHRQEMDDWIILPYLLSAQHYYAKTNLFLHLKKSLMEEFRAVETTFGQTALSISMDENFRDCRNLIIKSMINNYVDNPFSLSCLTKECLIDLNKEGFRYLIKLYELIFRRCMGYNLPTFGNNDLELPVFYHSDQIVPLVSNFIAEPPALEVNPNAPALEDINSALNNSVASPPTKAAEIPAQQETKALNFTHCLIPLNITPVTQESLDFIRSTLSSPIPDIFRTELIQFILLEK